jgi:hypothetical protein
MGLDISIFHKPKLGHLTKIKILAKQHLLVLLSILLYKVFLGLVIMLMLLANLNLHYGERRT